MKSSLSKLKSVITNSPFKYIYSTSCSIRSQLQVPQETKVDFFFALGRLMRKQQISSDITSRWKYDVFLSFRGEDTRRGFTDHLYTALERQGITTFKDDPELEKGKTISPALFAAVEESRFALIVLSKNYASSTWCLDELVRILECMKARETVLPVFYGVDPSDVRKQTGREAFADHEKRYDMEKVRRWRYALIEIANFSGWNSSEWYESKLITNIVEVIWTTLRPTSYTYSENLVGIHSRLQEVNLLLGVGVGDVRFIGIWGMGGIGKTTIVRAVYDKISREFEFSFILVDVRNSVEKFGVLELQIKLLSEIWKKNANISDIHEGATLLERLLRKKKVLLILDDVDHISHLKYLAGNEEWFGLGSRILITTRNENLLVKHGVERRLKPRGLNDDESLELFSWKAFKRDYPEEDFVDMSKSVINYAEGLPLALEVLGASLLRRDMSEWKSALGKIGRVCNLEIFDILKTSYDGLDDEEKKIFLDIACFFNGQEKDRVTEVLSSCDVSATIGIKILMERSLLALSYGRLKMHDLLQEMGREIIRQESPNEPSRCSRLWLLEDIQNVLTNNTGTEAIEGIFLDSTELEVHENMDRKSFSMMNKLRYLKINNGKLPEGLEYLPNSLRILDWMRYPLESLPSQFNPGKLLELSLCHSHIKNFRIGTEPLYNLKTINLSHSQNLVTTANFNGMPHLKFLSLEGCIRLYKVDPGIEALERLVVLNLKDCKNLVHFARSVCGLKSLKILNLSGCSKISKLPNDTGHLESLEEFYLNETSIREIPTSPGMLEKLVVLNLKDCKNLVCLPSGVASLKSLKDLNLSGCSKLYKLPDEGHVNLKALTLTECRAQSFNSLSMVLNPFQWLLKRSSGLNGLHSLTTLDLSDCHLSEEDIPSDIGCLASLENLDLSKNQFTKLPNSISQLSRLENLYLDWCPKLRALPELSSQIWINLDNCILLDTLVSQQPQSNLVLHARCVNCFKMAETGSYKSNALSLLTRYLKFPRWSPSVRPEHDRFNFVVPGNEIPEWYNYQSVGSKIIVGLHPGWFCNEWMGYTTCVVFRLLKPLLPSVQMTLYCMLYINGDFIDGHGLSFGFEENCCQPKSDHILFFYGHRYTQRYCKEQWDDFYCQQDYCRFTFSFHPCFTEENREGVMPLKDFVQVKKCGVRIVYEEDVEELWQSLFGAEQYRTRPSTRR